MRLVRAPLALMFVIALGCTRAADLEDSLDKSQYSELFDHKLRVEVSAPIILAGRVVKFTNVGKPRPSPGDPPVRTQLTRITIDVETVIKGGISTSTVEFFYFTFATENYTDLGMPRYTPKFGQRRIFFLKSEKGSLRSVGDVTDYTLTLRSGRHSKDYCQGQNPGCCIARMLLIPGESGFDKDAFARDLYQSEYAAEVLCSTNEARALLESLTRHLDRKVAASARSTMTMLLSK